MQKSEAGAFGSNTGKEPQRPRLKLKNIDLLKIFALPAI